MDIRQTLNASLSRHQSTHHEAPAGSGFPSPAAGHEESSLSLDQHLVPHPSSTYFCRVSGNAMTAAGIHNDDLLVVDASLTPTHGRVVVAVVFGELVVRRLHIQPGGRWLHAESLHETPSPLDISRHDDDSLFWGVVTWVLHRP